MKQEKVPSPTPLRVYQSQPKRFLEYLSELWKYRSLIWVLAVREIKVQYSQTVLGIIWAVIKPMVAVFIYSVFFYLILEIRTGNIPYPVFVLPGVVIWFNFTQIISDGGTALQSNPDLIQKVEFPKLSLVLARTLSGGVDVVVSLLLLAGVMALFGFGPYRFFFLLPIFVLMSMTCGLTIAVWLSALTIRYRDLNQIIPYLISFLIWITPVFYPTTILPEKYEHLIYLNPISVVITSFRWSLLGAEPPPLFSFLVFVPVFLLLLCGVLYFKNIERRITDYI